LVEGGPSIGEEFFHIVGLRRRVGVPAGMRMLWSLGAWRRGACGCERWGWVSRPRRG
jgi:hypothetical protein